MEKAEIKRIAAIIKKLEALKKAEEEYQSDVADQIKEDVLLDLVDVEDCIAEHSKPEDGLGGNFSPPTGAFTRDLMCDVRYAVKSPKYEDTNTLILQLKIVQKRVEKSAGKGQEERGEAKVLKEQAGLNTESTLNSELKSLSEKIRQYRSREGVPDKQTDRMKRVRLNDDGEMYIAKDLDYKVAYEDAWDQALNIKQKFTGLTELPRNESDPMIGLRYLEEWCYTNSQRVAGEHFKLPAGKGQESKAGKKARSLEEILIAVKKWRVAGQNNQEDSEIAQLLGTKAMQLITENLELLTVCLDESGGSLETKNALSTHLSMIEGMRINNNLSFENMGGYNDYHLFTHGYFTSDIKTWITSSKNNSEETPSPIDTEGLWESASLKKLRDIDSNSKRDGITGDKQALKRLKEYLTRRRKRKDIAETLYLEDRRIKTTMPHHSMFKQK